MLYSWEPEYRDILKSSRNKVVIKYFDEKIAEALLDHSLYEYLDLSISLSKIHRRSKIGANLLENFEIFIDFLSKWEIDKIYISDFNILGFGKTTKEERQIFK